MKVAHVGIRAYMFISYELLYHSINPIFRMKLLQEWDDEYFIFDLSISWSFLHFWFYQIR